jgi:DNA-binding NarL/FixJ family response regulator
LLFQEEHSFEKFRNEAVRMGYRFLKAAMKTNCQSTPVLNRIATGPGVRLVVKINLPAGSKLRCPLGAAMFSEQAWREIARSLKLSGQELQIVRGVFDDCTEFAIANNLNVSPHTVHTHCERLYHKLTVTDRVKLVLRVIDEFLALTAASGTSLPPICADRAADRCPLRRT